MAALDLNAIRAIVEGRLATELAIVENLQRKDLNPLEKAASFQQYLERYACTQEELAGRLKICAAKATPNRQSALSETS